ncbi:MAG: MopE-related protein, partial [Myxococcota bacterium]|nr:MopE-related protein [Myxococcota bacterium]
GSWAEGGEELKIDRGTPSSPSYGLIEIVFKPDTEGRFRTVLTITSDDTEVTERDENNHGLWKVVLRGIGRYPCGEVHPDLHDFGYRPAGGYFTASSTVENCGGTLLTIADFEPESAEGGISSFSVSTPTPIYVLPGQSKEVEFAYEPAGGSPATAAAVTITSNAPSLADRTIALIGNDCDDSADAGWDADGDGWFACAGDCNDRLAEVSPSAVERPDNSVDDDCDGLTDEPPNEVTTDEDGDGFTEADGDCDDADSDIHPDSVEVNNQIDDDCNGLIDDGTANYDDDGDGFAERAGDCEDTDPAVFPGAEETENGVDDDCDGRVDEGSPAFDDDGDGVAETDAAPDCNDDDPWTYTGADEDCDGLDNDCDGLIDEGPDDAELGACGFLVERREAATAA